MELRIENLTKAYGKKVTLSDFSTTLTSCIYGLLGSKIHNTICKITCVDKRQCALYNTAKKKWLRKPRFRRF